MQGMADYARAGTLCTIVAGTLFIIVIQKYPSERDALEFPVTFEGG